MSSIIPRNLRAFITRKGIKSKEEKELLTEWYGEQQEKASKDTVSLFGWDTGIEKTDARNAALFGLNFVLPAGGWMVKLATKVGVHGGAAIKFLFKTTGSAIEKYVTQKAINETLGFDPKGYLGEIKYHKELFNKLDEANQKLETKDPKFSDNFIAALGEEFTKEVIQKGREKAIDIEGGGDPSKVTNAQIMNHTKEQLDATFGFGEDQWKLQFGKPEGAIIDSSINIPSIKPKVSYSDVPVDVPVDVPEKDLLVSASQVAQAGYKKYYEEEEEEQRKDYFERLTDKDYFA